MTAGLVFIFWAVVWAYGGWNAPSIVVSADQGPCLFLMGIVIMLVYIPLHQWRRSSDRGHRHGDDSRSVTSR